MKRLAKLLIGGAIACVGAAIAAGPAAAQPKGGAQAPPPKGPAPNDPLPPEKDPPPVDQAQVDAAVARGAEWLRAQVKAGLPPINWAEEGAHAGQTYNEMVLYTLLHAGVDRGDPDIIKLVNEIRAKPPCHTYTGAMRAMALEMYDPVKLRQEVVQTAQFLVDNQGNNGMWGYSRPIPWPQLPPVIFTPTSAPPRYITTGPQAAPGPSTAPAPVEAKPAEPVRRWPDGSPMNKPASTELKKQPPKLLLTRHGTGSPHDNSNTQYAILGLRACMGQGILPPPETLQLTENWFTTTQNADGGWGYTKSEKSASYGSMTAGAVSSLGVCIRGTKNADPRKDPRVQRGIEWLAKNLDFGKNPHHPDGEHAFHYYWIYSVERAGALAETEWFGDRAWYPEGARALLGSQSGEGCWHGADKGWDILDTCWAILFLRRATKHIADQKPPPLSVVVTR